MINSFNSFLIESLDVEKLKHLEHAEDHIIHGGHEGISHASDTLSDTLAFLEGKKSKTKITTKYDGAPSIVFGINPENGKFFVASKSAFNKNPKLNYTEKDIEENHGHAPGLVAKLKSALEHLPKVMPKEGGVYQGDLMYTSDDLVDNGDSYSFTPNTITYSAEKNSAHGRAAAAAKLGLVVHTKYKGKKLEDMKADFNVDQRSFGRDPDVHMVNPELNAGSITGLEKKKYEKHIQNALSAYQATDHDAMEVLDGHDITLKTYINQTVRDGTRPDAKGYFQFMMDRAKKDVDKVKTETTKKKKEEQHATVLSHIENHLDQFQNILNMHFELQNAKDTLVGAMSRADTGFKTTIGGKPTKPEGFVAIRNGRPTKLVDRSEFSRQNFLKGTFSKAGEPEPPKEDMPKNPVVFGFGRMNPPTTGHQVLVDKIKDLAKENKAKHEVVLSHSQDPEKNPLTADQKLIHAKRFFPDTNISVASDDMPSFLHHAKRLSAAGHDHLIMVAGSDRVEEYKKILDKYNGKDFNFKKIDVISAGQRDPDAEGTEGMSASKMRGHAITNKYSEFKRGIPSHIHPEHAKELYNNVRQGMDIKIDANTSGISLARYAKRQDPVGVRARREMMRREQAKAIEKKRKQLRRPIPKKRIVSEELTSSSGDVRGLGFITGDPGGVLTTWVSMNAADADTRDQIINTMKNKLHDKYHYDPATERNERVKRIISIIKDNK